MLPLWGLLNRPDSIRCEWLQRQHRMSVRAMECIWFDKTWFKKKTVASIERCFVVKLINAARGKRAKCAWIELQATRVAPSLRFWPSVVNKHKLCDLWHRCVTFWHRSSTWLGSDCSDLYVLSSCWNIGSWLTSRRLGWTGGWVGCCEL
jgi:hypothetical protein